MPFQMPQLQDNIGNALSNISQIRQQRTQNALAERQASIAEQAAQRQQQQFDAQQAEARKAELMQQTRNATGALLRVPRERREQLFAQLAPSLDPDLVRHITSNPGAFDDENLTLAYNQSGELTADQQASDAAKVARARIVPRYSIRETDGSYVGINEYDPTDVVTTGQRPRSRVGDQPRQPAAPRVAAAQPARGAPAPTGSAQPAPPAPPRLPAAAITAITNNRRSLSLLKAQLANVRSAWARIKDTTEAGPGQGLLPTPDGQRFDRAVTQLAPFFRQISRTPGEGATSDYESRLQQAALPSRTDYEATTEDSIANIENIISALEQEYDAALGARPQSPAPPSGAPRVGTVQDGYVYMGGDPSNPKSWKKQ
jgi:hypothetical protein